MPTLKQKNVIKSYKLRLQEKLKTITEETERASSFLNSCVSEFQNRVDQILKIKDEKCLSLYRKLIRDLESYSEKLFILQASIEEVSGEESECSEDDQSAVVLSRHQSHAFLHQVPQAESKIPHPTVFQDVSVKSSVVQNTDESRVTDDKSYEVPQAESKTHHPSVQGVNLRSSGYQNNDEDSITDDKSYEGPQADSKTPHPPVQGVNLRSSGYQNNDEDSVADDKFCSFNSVDVLNAHSSSLNSRIDACHADNVGLKKSESNISASQNSCYCSLSSNTSESFACNSDSRSVRSLGATFQELKTKDSFELPSDSPAILPPVLEVSSKFSATLSYIIDPGNFWIQIENSYSSNLSFPKSESGNFRNLSSIKEGTYCLAPFKTTSFYYRAQSLSDAQSALENVKVIFIDHGSSQYVPLCDLRSLPESAYSIPAQAIHCYLFGIVPNSSSWSEESIERFKDFQNCCLETSVKSKEDLYGVELVSKLAADLDDDFSVDIAQALCLDGLAAAINESPGPSISLREHSKAISDPTNSSLDLLGSYNVNAISNDSGVSVSSSGKSDNLNGKKDKITRKGSNDYVSRAAVKTPETASSDRNLVTPNCDTQVNDLILFDSRETLGEFPNSCENVDSPDPCCPICRKRDFCLHLNIPSPSLSFVEKDMVLVMLSNIVSPSEFYVNMAQENIMTLDDLREQMTSLYDSIVNWHQVKAEDLRRNMYCAGRFDQDKYWYRIKVLRISPEDKKQGQALVQYVDYGNVDIISCHDIQPLTQSFSQHPVFAIKCSLAGVTPLDRKKKDWGDDAIKEFKNITSYERCLTAQICTEICPVQNDTYPVLLWDNEDSKDLLLNSLLAERKVALFDYSLLHPSGTNQSDLKPHIDMDTWNPMAEEYYQIENNYAMDDENLEMVTTGYQAKDEKYTCKYFSLRGFCPRGDNCRYEHHTLLETGVTRDQEEVFCLDTVPLLSENVSNILMQVSAIVSPGCFYAILPFGCKSVDEIDQLVYSGVPPIKIANSEAKALFCALDKHYSKSPFLENTTISLSCGTIVVAKRQFDGKWHRARIVDVVGVDKPAKVFFVDSGDQEWVPRRLIRTILPQFLHTPFQAIQCSLHKIDPVGYENGQSWSSEAVQYFKDVVMGEVLLAETVQRIGPIFQVSLRKTSRDNHLSVSQLLISAGLAQPSQSVPVNNREILYVPG